MGRRQRVCIVSGCFWGQLRGGAEYQSYLIASELVKRGYEVKYLFIDQGTSIVKYDGIQLIPLRGGKLASRIVGTHYFTLYARLMKALRDAKPDMILNQCGDALTGICSNYAKKNNCRMVWHIASLMDIEPYHFKWSRFALFEYIEKKILEYGIRHADYVIGQTRYQSKLLEMNYGRGCDVVLPNPHPVPSKVCLDKPAPPLVVWIANIKGLKRPELFIALARACRDLDARFIFAGWPAGSRYQGKLMRVMANLSNVTYLGELSSKKVNELLSAASVFVNTSLPIEGFPNTFVQAWMRSVPTVSLDCDPDDVIKRNKIGFHSRNFEQLVNDVRLLVEDERLRQEMGQRAREYAVSHHDIAEVMRGYVNLFERKLEKHR